MGIVGAVFNVIISFCIPLGVLGYLLIRKRSYLKYFLFGICGFTISQILIRIPLLSLVQGTDAYLAFGALYPLLIIFLLALSAGLFEEPARFLFLRHTSKRDADLNIPLFYGLGHAGVEAIVFVGLQNLVLLFTQQSLLLTLNVEVFLAGFERISAFMLHIALSLIIYYGIMKAKKRYLLLAIAFHTLMNCTLILAQLGVSLLVFELVLFSLALIFLLSSVLLVRKAFRGDSQSVRLIYP